MINEKKLLIPLIKNNLPILQVNNRISEFGVPILSNSDIENYTTQILLNINPNFLNEIKKVDIDYIIEFVAMRKLTYCKLSLDGHKWGSTAMNDGSIITYLADGTQRLIQFNTSDICIEEKLLEHEKLLRFTLAHELGHSILHAGLGIKLNNQVFDTKETLYKAKYDKEKGFSSPEQWIEHQANVFAASLLMPKSFVRDLFNKYTTTFSHLNQDYDYVINCISAELGVSLEAVTNRLLTLKLIK